MTRDSVVGSAFAVALVAATALFGWYGDDSQASKLAEYFVLAGLVGGFFLYLKFGRRG